MLESIVYKGLTHCESRNIELVCVELTISKRIWSILFAYQPQISIKKSSSYDNIIFAGDLNIDLLYPSKDTSNNLFGLLDNFNKGSLIHIRSNKPMSFHET